MQKSPRTVLADKLVIYAMNLLLEQPGNRMPGRDVVEELGKNFEKIISPTEPWMFDTYESSSDPKWLRAMQFASIKFVKAGFLSKRSKIWYLEQDGIEVLKKFKNQELTEIEFADMANKGYRDWKAQTEVDSDTEQKSHDIETEESEDVDDIESESINERARNQIYDYISSVDAYEYQDLVAALLRGMGYYISLVAERGADGGVDIVAYRDPLGTEAPRLKVQVKHHKEKIGPDPVRQLQGILRDGDIGVLVCSSDFTPKAQDAARSGAKHTRLINKNQFVGLWCEHYENMKESDRLLLPLKKIYLLDKELE